MESKVNLKYGTRNISLKETFCFNKSKRVICKLNVLFNIFSEAISQKINMYMFVFAYEGKMYCVSYEFNKSTYKFCLGLPNNTIKEFSDIEQLKQCDVLSNITGNVTILQEFIEGPMHDYIDVPLSSNVLLKEYLIDTTSPDYNLNISEEIIENYEKNTGTDVGIKNILKTIGIIIVFLLIYGIISAMI